MFSSRAFKYMRQSAETVNFWGSLPFSWDRVNDKIKPVDSSWRRIFWYLHIFAQAAHFIFLLLRYIEFKYFNKTATPTMRIYTEYATLSYSIPVIFQFCILARKEELADFFHDYTELYSRLQEKYRITASVGADCDRFLTFMMRSGKLICWINVLVLFRRPARPVLLTSLVANPKALRPWEILPFAVPHIFVWWSMWSLLHVWAIYLLTYVFSTIALTRALRSGTGADGAVQRNFIKLYRCLQLLQKKQDDAYGLTLASHKVLFILVVVRSIYSALVMEGEIRILLAVVGMSTWFYLQVAFKTLAQVNLASILTLETWNGRRMDAWFRRFRRSCPPLKVQIGSLYYVDKGMPLTLAAIIVESTVNLLLAEK